MIGLEQFALAGKATFTAVSKATNKRFTFKVTAFDEPRFFTHAIFVMSGPDNESSYSYMACMTRDREIKWTQKSRVSQDALSAKAFKWIWKHRNSPDIHEKVEIMHAGKCCCCGRKLTEPESIQTGIGPICRQRKGW